MRGGGRLRRACGCVPRPIKPGLCRRGRFGGGGGGGKGAFQGADDAVRRGDGGEQRGFGLRRGDAAGDGLPLAFEGGGESVARLPQLLARLLLGPTRASRLCAAAGAAWRPRRQSI